MRFIVRPSGSLDGTFVGRACPIGGQDALVVGTVGAFRNELRAAAFRCDAKNGVWCAVRPPPALVAVAPGALIALSETVVACVAGRSPRRPGDAASMTLASLFLYDVTRDTWQEARSLSAPREFFSASLLQDGTLLVMGGAGDGQRSPKTTGERYFPGRNEWVAVASMPDGRMEHHAAVLKDGRVLVAGGAGPEKFRSPQASTATFLYDPALDKWTTVGHLAHQRTHHALVALPDGRAAVVGGWGGPAHEIAEIEVFDPSTERWNPGGTLRQGRMDAAVSALPDGTVLVVGGSWTEGELVRIFDGVEFWDPETGSSHSGALRLGPRVAPDLVPFGSDRLVVVGGLLGAAKRENNSTEVFDFSLGT